MADMDHRPSPRPPDLPELGPDDPIFRLMLRFTVHVRRHLTLYALLVVFGVSMMAFPSARRTATTEEPAALAGSTAAYSQTTASGVQAQGPVGGEVVAAASVGSSGPAALGGGTPAQQGARTVVQQAVAQQVQPGVAGGVHVGAGVTRGGFDCRPDVRQLPWSAYAAPCVARWEGDNRGATYRGVTKDSVLILRRRFPSSTPETDEDRQERERREKIRDTYIDYFNKAFELYGRKVAWQTFDANPQANSTLEAQSQGKEGACIDATKAVEELKGFATLSASGPYGECAAERKMVTFETGAYFNEGWFRKLHPYAWSGLMECERIGIVAAEYTAKRLYWKDGKPGGARLKARWAGDPVLQQTDRKFGTMVPNNDQYQTCTDLAERDWREKYKITGQARYNYALDVSRFPDEAARAMIQFKADGVTTVLLYCDPYIPVFMTQAAEQQQYRPEWFEGGTALNDTDAVARLWATTASSQIDGHLFGISQLGGDDKVWGAASEPMVTYKRITGQDVGEDDRGSAAGSYWGLMRIYSFLQVAGPVLTPETIDKGVHAMPPGGAPGFAVGYSSYADGPDGTPRAGDHSAIDDNRELYWDGQATAPDGKKGHYFETYGGRRFRNNEWPAEEPPIYPNRK